MHKYTPVFTLCQPKPKSISHSPDMYSVLRKEKPNDLCIIDDNTVLVNITTTFALVLLSTL